MFSHTLSFLSSRNVNGQVSHPYKTTGKIIFYKCDNIIFFNKYAKIYFEPSFIPKNFVLILRPLKFQILKSGPKSYSTISELQTPAKGYIPFEFPDCRTAW